MKALLTSATEHTKMKDEQLPSSTLSQESKNEEISRHPSFVGLMIGLLGMEKKSNTEGNSSAQAKEALAGSVNIKKNVTANKKEAHTLLTNADSGMDAQNGTGINKEAGKKVLQQNKINVSGKNKKLATQASTAATKNVDDSPEAKMLTPRKENAPSPTKVAVGIMKDKQENISLTLKGTAIEKGDTLKKKINSNSNTAAKIGVTDHKRITIERTSETKKQSLKTIPSIPETLSKGRGIQNGSKLAVNKTGEKAAKLNAWMKKMSQGNEKIILRPTTKDQSAAAKAPIIKQGQSVKKSSSSIIQENILARKAEQDIQTKLVYKDGAKLTLANKEKKQTAISLFRKKTSKLDGKLKEQLIKQVSNQSTDKKESNALLSKSRSLEYSGTSSSKATSGTLKPLNGKSLSVQTSPGGQKNIHATNLQDLKDLNNTGKEVEIHNLKTTQLTSSGGRSKFGKLLAHVTRQPVHRQSHTGRQATNTQWKHHRFILKDGNTVNIAARTSSGALQLQLSAGNGELSRIIQQHLHEIRQHVQQELDVEIDLQLQDFGEQQTDQQDDSASERNTPDDTDAGERNLTSNLTEQIEDHQIRYLGFNKNEWVA